MSGFNIKSIRFKNFMSVGAVEQHVDFFDGRMTVVTGEDLDAPKTKRSGIGKAQPLNAKVLTPTGWTTIGKLRIGDAVTTPSGTTTMVNGTFPQGTKQTFKVHLEDGRTTRACREHLWKITSDTHTVPTVIQTEDIQELLATEKVYLPVSEGVVIPNIRDFGCSPYLMSIALLAGEINDNGYLVLKTFDEHVFGRLQYLFVNDHISFDMTDHGIMVYDTRTTDNIATTILSITSEHNIDEFVKYATMDQRVEFFRGVCDLHGHEENNKIQIVVPDPHRRLVLALRELVWSMGGVCRLRRVIVGDEFMHTESEFRIECTFRNSNEFFYAIEKRVYGLIPDLGVRIIQIEEDTTEECVCISLISSEKLYITDNYIVTHNTTVPNALTFALYGKPISSIKMGRLVNKRNKKEMYVRVDFEKDGQEYFIERGVKPDVFRFCKSDGEEELNQTYGSKSDTQIAIERLIGMSYDLFTMIVTINTMKESYMKSKLSKQRDIIEEILNISELTRKSNILSEYKIKATKSSIEAEKARINANEALRTRLTSNLQSVKAQSERWNVDREDDINHYVKQAESLLNVDIDAEIAAHQHNEQVSINDNARRTLINENAQSKSLIAQGTKRLSEIDRDIQAYEKKQCPTCNQELHDDSHEQRTSALINEAQEYFTILEQSEALVKQRDDEIAGIVVDSKKQTVYSNIHDAYKHREKINALHHKIEELSNSVNPFAAAIDESAKQLAETVVDYTELQRLERLLDHQQFLLKILSGRDSFVRKRIIDVSIPLLNERIAFYAAKTDITHTIKFESDLTLEIVNNGEDYDFDNLSRGEQNWAIIALNLAMRDLYEQIHGSHNILFVDELIDFGIDTAQSVDAFNILRDISRNQNKSLSLITHREELFERADDILFVEKANGFTTYQRTAN